MSDNRPFLEAEQAATYLQDLDDNSLFEDLGIRLEDIRNVGGWQRANSFSADYQQYAQDMISMGDVRELGRQWWLNLEPQLMALVCDQSNDDMKKITGGKSVAQVAAGLATAGVISVFGPPAWIIVATTIVATKIVQSGLDATCAVWHAGRCGREQAKM